ncbi:MMPL family transporter [Tundrisphaera lichenicola]|uniref:MMPL family transporter n=1 Tax=Tundrisphaera lichenicola TaxID=2029860 RepID=UPI003EBB1D07
MIDTLRAVVTRHPGRIVGFWVVLAVSVGLAAPDLTRLAAEGQAHLIDEDSESARGGALIRDAWPDQSFESQVVVALHRPAGLTVEDRAYARRLADRFEHGPGRAQDILRVIGPGSRPEIAARLLSQDGTLELIAVPLSTSFVAPTAEVAVDWLQAQAARPGLSAPSGLEVRWTGDAAIGRDYMANVQTSLDRAALATVVLLLGVLLFVYRSIWLALVPLITIGMCLIISRSILAWMAGAGWEISPLVELFLIVLLFGTGTDFCLFVSWRFGEHWDARNPGAAMRITLRRGGRALVTSAGTVFVGLMLMGTTKFKLFSSTGPSVAMGLVVTLCASLTLAPALLVLLARWRPGAFAGMTGPSSGFWDRFAHRALSRPILSWAGAIALMAPLAWLGTRTEFTQDTLLELPSGTDSAEALRLVAQKFGPGLAAPLTVVVESKDDLRKSEGLALIDELSRMLSRQKQLAEVRSATQPLGSPEPLDPARLSARLAAVNQGFGQIEAGADQLRAGLEENLNKIRAARWLIERTGLPVPRPDAPAAADAKASREAIAKGFRTAGSLLVNPGRIADLTGGRSKPSEAAEPPRPLKPDATTEQLARAVEGAGLIADGIRRASDEIGTILEDPVGRQALDRLLITPGTVRDHPELRESFDTYITPDGKAARIDVTQTARIFSAEAMDGVLALRRKIDDRLDEQDNAIQARALVAGPNAESADIRALTRSDQVQSWFVVPIGVFIVLILALRDPVACMNLVATMLLTYLFALGATHLLFITILGSEGLDWKVPYFLFVLLVAVGVDYNVFLMARLREEVGTLGLRAGICRAVAQTGGLISSAAAITAISFASLLFSPLSSLRQLGFALVIGITVDALLVRPLLVPCGHWLLNRRSESNRVSQLLSPRTEMVTRARN